MKTYMRIPVGVDHEEKTFDLSKLTTFQVETLRGIVGHQDFDFCCQSEISSSGPVMFLWYNKDYYMHARRIGRVEILWSFDGPSVLKPILS